MSESLYLGNRARVRLLSLGGRSPSYQDAVSDDAENLRKRLLSGPTVDIFVGHERKQWSLHRNLLCHHSAYFETEFSRHDEKIRNVLLENKLELPDDDPAGFELLVKWLYQGQLEDASHMSDEAKYDYAVACHKLYLLCDKFGMVRLKNIAMDQYRQCLNESQLVPDAEEINEIYRASPVDSPFRSLMIRIAARQIMDPDVDRDAEAYRKCFENNSSFAVEMVNAIRKMSGGILFEDPTSSDLCAYHDHTDPSGCPLRGKSQGRAMRSARVGVINGQGHHYYQHGIPIPMMAELSSEKRTPRKLDSPSPRLNRVFSRTSPGLKRAITPRKQRRAATDANAHSIAPTLRLSEKEDHPSGQLPIADGKAIARESDPWNPSNRDTARQRLAPSGGSEAQSNSSSNSRKRKLAYRSPNVRQASKLDDGFDPPATAAQPADLDNRRPALSRSSTGRSSTTSRAASIASGGPRKLSRISSVAKRYDKLNGTLYIVDSRSEVGGVKRRKPPKLRPGSAKALNGD